MDNSIINSTEELFEQTLKNMSVQAFDSLLTCGVRDFSGLLRLTKENLLRIGTPAIIAAELMDIQFHLRDHMTKLGQGGYENDQKNTICQIIREKQKAKFKEQGNHLTYLPSGTPIPTRLIESLPIRARNALIRENILTCERLLQFDEQQLFCTSGIGRKTVFDIRRLQEKVINGHNKLSQGPSEIAKRKSQRQSSNTHKSFLKPQSILHRASDPAEWSLLSKTLPQILKVKSPRWNILNDEDCKTINDIGIPNPDMICLKETVLGAFAFSDKISPREAIFHLFCISY